MIIITPEITLDENEISYEFVKATGPGGQNVNKVATAVQLSFDIINSNSLPDAVKKRLVEIAGNRVNSQGVLRIDAKRFRTQTQNREDALNRLVAMILQTTYKPKKRKKTKRSRASQERRLQMKKQHSEKKKRRGRVDW
jgi:ribosome-associated protein